MIDTTPRELGCAHEQIEPGRPPPARLVNSGGKSQQLVDVTPTLTNRVVALRIADDLRATTSNTDRAALGGDPAKGGHQRIRRIELVPPGIPQRQRHEKETHGHA